MNTSLWTVDTFWSPQPLIIFFMNLNNSEMKICKFKFKCKFKPEKNFRTSTGFEPMASALALQCSTNWAMKTHILEAGQFIEFILTRDRNET